MIGMHTSLLYNVSQGSGSCLLILCAMLAFLYRMENLQLEFKCGVVAHTLFSRYPPHVIQYSFVPTGESVAHYYIFSLSWLERQQIPRE